jgi:hypothetical protein
MSSVLIQLATLDDSVSSPLTKRDEDGLGHMKARRALTRPVGRSTTRSHPRFLGVPARSELPLAAQADLGC